MQSADPQASVRTTFSLTVLFAVSVAIGCSQTPDPPPRSDATSSSGNSASKTDDKEAVAGPTQPGSLKAADQDQSPQSTLQTQSTAQAPTSSKQTAASPTNDMENDSAANNERTEITVAEEGDVDGLFQEAIARGKALTEDYPNLPDAQELLARIYWITGQFSQAEAIWTKIVEQTPSYAYAHHGLGQAAAKRGDFELAAKYHTTASELQPSYEEATLYRAAALTKIGEVDTAIQVLSEFLNQRPSVSAQLKLGQAYLASKHFAEAKDTFEEVLERAPDNLESLSGLAIAQSRTGQRDKAIETRNRLALLRKQQRSTTMESRKSTNDFDLQQEALASRLFSVGQVYFSKQRWAKAEEVWKRAYELNKQDRSPLEQLAALYIGLGDAENALTACTKLYNAAPENPNYAFNYAMVLDRTGKQLEAIDVLNKTAGQSPSTQVLGMLADLQLRTGSVDAAGETVRKALKLAPENPQLKSLLANIEAAEETDKPQ